MSAKQYPSESDRRKAEYQRAKARRQALALPDPITLLSTEERAYIAGILDGEGSLTIGHVGPKKLTYYPIVAVAMTHLGVIQWLQAKLLPGNIKLNNHTRVRQGWKPQHCIMLHGKRAKLLCETVLPYMHVRDEHARLIAAFPCDGRTGPGRTIAPDVQAMRADLYAKMKPLNKRGRE